MNLKRSLILLLVAIVLTACSTGTPLVLPTETSIVILPMASNTPAAGINTPASTVAPTSAPNVAPTIAPTVAPTVAPTIAPTQAPVSGSYTPFKVTTMVDGAKLRTNPGYLFPASRLLSKGVSLTVYGISKGGEWVYVDYSGIKGWIFSMLVEVPAGKELSSAPEVEPGNVKIVRGKVADASGNPISGIQFAFTQGSQRNDAMTDASGTFYSYLPLDAKGTWAVTYVAISGKSNAFDASGNCKIGKCEPDPKAKDVVIELSDMLYFGWK